MNTNGKTVLFIAYNDPQRVTSGSGLRPAKMLEAFKDAGCEVIVLYKEQIDRERPQAIADTIDEIKKHRPDFCYIESSTYPIMRHADRKLIKTVHKMGIPTAYFYRDFYRQFPEQFPRRKDFLGRMKELALDFLQFLTDKVLRYCDIIYVPSEECKRYVSHRNIKTLPPAGEDCSSEGKELNHNIIYVGGMSSLQYNGDLILATAHELYERDNRYKMILVSRDGELDGCSSPYKNGPWVELHHASGKELEPLYNSSSVAISALRKEYPYSDLCVPVKIFEYLGHGLPQVAVNVKSVKSILETEQIGYAVDATPAAMADAIEDILSDPCKYREITEHLHERLIKNNLWVHRAQKVISDLTE